MAPIELTTDFGCAPAPALGHSDEHSVLTHMPGYQNLLDFGARNGKLNGRFKNTYPRFGPAAKLVEVRVSQKGLLLITDKLIAR